MKKFWLICGLLCLALVGAACAAPKTTPAAEAPPPEEEAIEPLLDLPVKNGHYIIENEHLGLSFGIPIRQMEDYTIFYGQLTVADVPEDTPPIGGMLVSYYPPGLMEEIMKLLSNSQDEETVDEAANMLITRSRPLYSIQFYSAGLWDSWIIDGKTIAEITGNEENSELGRQNGRVYMYTSPAPSEEGLVDEELTVYRQAVADIPAMRELAAMIELAPVVVKYNLPAFSAVDIYGAAVDNSIFADYDLTMLNIWGTFCGPCIVEMPDLGEMAADMPAGTQLVGLVGDAVDKATIELAQTIVQQTGAAFLHIVPDEALNNFMNRDISFFPTTLFIDSQGKTIGEPVIGGMSREKYEEELTKRLQTLH